MKHQNDCMTRSSILVSDLATQSFVKAFYYYLTDDEARANEFLQEAVWWLRYQPEMAVVN